jgi:hypothetical protein
MLALLFVTAVSALRANEFGGEGRRVLREVAGVDCVMCHGEFAERDVSIGRYFPAASEGTIRAAIEAVDEMIIVGIVTECRTQ